MKRKRISRISGFTLFELLLVMILISIIVTILGSTLYHVNGFHKRLKDRVDRVASFKMFNYIINRDFNRMKFYEVNMDRLTFTDGMDTVFYSFGESIVRQQRARVDSIPLNGTIIYSDTITSIRILLGERSTQIRMPAVSSGVLSYQASKEGDTENETE